MDLEWQCIAVHQFCQSLRRQRHVADADDGRLQSMPCSVTYAPFADKLRPRQRFFHFWANAECELRKLLRNLHCALVKRSASETNRIATKRPEEPAMEQLCVRKGVAAGFEEAIERSLPLLKVSQ